MPRSEVRYDQPSDASTSVLREDGIESGFIGRLQALKYEYRRGITNRATLEQNFREKFEALYRVLLTHAEFARLLYESLPPPRPCGRSTSETSTGFLPILPHDH